MFLVLFRLFNILKINVYEKVFMDSVFVILFQRCGCGIRLECR